jgi:hypothetical protein
MATDEAAAVRAQAAQAARAHEVAADEMATRWREHLEAQRQVEG